PAYSRGMRGNRVARWMARGLAAAAAAACVALATGAAALDPTTQRDPQAEFHMARLVYANGGGSGGRGMGFGRPWWAIDYPEAEFHLTQGLRRLTRLRTADDSIHLQATDEALFDHPWLFAQQVGRWALSDAEVARLREYLLRGGFLVVDDFHGPLQWELFMASFRKLFPDRPIVDLRDDDEVLHVLYDLEQRTQIPGRRHLVELGGGRVEVAPEGAPPTWRGVFDDAGRLMVVINFNMDMGDAWEHADDPVYPEPMTALAYRFGVNYILYAMTH
ncbi:MAG: hypothetical protein RL026_1053, partial [Pseudomonadota bacterium]